MARIKIKKTKATRLSPITGSIVNGTNFVDKEHNTYSANTIDGLVSKTQFLNYFSNIMIGDIPYIADIKQGVPFISRTNGETLNTPYKDGLTSSQEGLLINIKPFETTWTTLVYIPVVETCIYMRRVLDNWEPWHKIGG